MKKPINLKLYSCLECVNLIPSKKEVKKCPKCKGEFIVEVE